MESVCIYGGGNIAHSLAAVISVTQPVTVVTRRPEAWNSRMAFVQEDKMHWGLNAVNATSDVSTVRMADIVFVALPQFAIDGAIGVLMASLKYGATVVFVPAPAKAAEYAKLLVDRGYRVAGLQRVPFISRINEYGSSVTISAPRQIHKLVVSEEGMRLDWSCRCHKWFGGNVEYLSSFLTFAFSNSNPLLHPSRLVVLFEDWEDKCYKYNPPFYGEWTDKSSDLYIAADMEMLDVMSHYHEIDITTDYESVLDHYNVKSASELTLKIRSIPSFQTILSPMREERGKWLPDFQSRYFTEDIPFGTRPIYDLGRRKGIKAPTIGFLINAMDAITKSSHN